MADPKPRSQADWEKLETLYPGYLSGDVQATLQLFSEILRALQGYFRVRLGAHPDAEDLSQVTLLKIHFSRDRYDPKHRLKTWVFTIASRTLIDHWRGAASDRDVFEGGASLQGGEDEVVPNLAMKVRNLHRLG